VNIIQVASSSILPNDEKFLKSNNRNDRNENNNIKSIVLPRIQTPSYKNLPNNVRSSNNYVHNINNHTDIQSNFNNKCMIQKNTR